MNEVGRLPAALLRVAAGRWPAEFRDRMLQEWTAELAMMNRQAGRGGQMARFIASLLVSALWRRGDDLPPPVRGVPVLPATALLLSGIVLSIAPLMVIIGVSARSWESLQFSDTLQLMLLTPMAVVLGVVLGYGLGSRWPAEPGERHGPATSAVLAASCLTVAFLTRAVTGVFRVRPELPESGGVILAGLVWGPAIGYLAVRAVHWWTNGHRWRVGLAVPVLATGAGALAAIVGALPMLVPALAHGGPRFALSLLTAPAMPSEVVPVDYPYPSYATAEWMPVLIGSGLLVLVYGLRAARHKTGQVPIAAETSDPSDDSPQPVRVTAIGAGALVAGALSWAYATTLKPLMNAMNDTYDQQYGHWKISTSSFVGVQDLRWGGILLAVLGLVVVTARHTRPGTAAGVLSVLLLALDGFANRSPESLLTGPRFLLAATAGAILVAWWVSGPAMSMPAALLRRRLLVPAVLAAGALPCLYWQLPEAADHRYLPTAYFIPMVVLPAAGAALAAVCATAVRAHPPARATTVLLIALPVPAVLYGIAVLTSSYLTITIGATVVPAAVIALTLLHLSVVFRTAQPAGTGSPARIGRSVALWCTAIIATSVASLLSFVLMYPINLMLSVIATGGSFDDGAALLPGVVTMLFLIGHRAVNGPGGQVAGTTPEPAGPDQTTEPRQHAESAA